MEGNAPNQENSGSSAESNSPIPKVSVELSKVAANPKQGFAIIIAGVLVAAYLVWGTLSEEKTDKAKNNPVEKVEKPKVIAKPSSIDNSAQDTVIPELPKAPTLADPTAPPPPPVISPPIITDTPKAPVIDDKSSQSRQVNSNLPKPPVLDQTRQEPPRVGEITPKVLPPVVSKTAPSPLAPVTPLPSAPRASGVDPIAGSKVSKSVIPVAVMDPEKKKEKQQRQKSSIILVGGAPAKSEEKLEQDSLFKKKSDLEFVLAKGKIIDAVMETAINTDFPAEIRAVVSRDVYSESGKVILIPKGARVFGTFSGGVDGTYGRVDITWNRLDLPSGYTLTLQGTGVDELGRKGSEGRLDNKIKEKITNSVLSTAMKVAFAGAIDQVIKPENAGTQANKGMAVATNLQQAVQAAYLDPATTGQGKIAAMCTAATNAINDPTNPSYAQVQSACNTARSSTSTDINSVIQALNTSLMTAANNSIAQSVASSTPTKQQEATKKGMEDFTKTVEEVFKRAEPKPTVTIDQGAHVKIYVNRDYSFPKAAVNSSKVIQ
jgi:type IV secretion system protein VirB10